MAKKRISKKSESSVETLVQQINLLSAQDRIEFFKRIGGIDLARYLSAEIIIDDWKGADRTWPRATFRFSDETEECIDIIKSVRENAASIGHPLILHAIRRWERFILYHSALSGGGQYKTSDINFYKLARNHLDNLGKALLEGAKNRAVPREYAPYIRRALGTDMDYFYLELAWKMLAEDEVKYKNFGQGIKKQRSPSDKRRLIAKKLVTATANWIYLQGSPVMRLQTSVARHDVLSGRMKYAILDPQIRMKDPVGNLMNLSSDSRISYSPELSEFQLWLKPPEGPLAWVTFDELMQRGGSHIKAENNTLRIGDLIEASGFRPPRQGSTERERKLAALMGLKEFALSPASSPGRQVYEPREIHYEYLESMKKKKLDLTIEFLESEKGERYLKARPSLAAFRSTFDAWRFGYNKATLRKYRSLARKNKEMREKIEGKDWLGIDRRFIPPSWLEGQFLFPDFIHEYDTKEIADWLALPLVPARTKK